MDGGKAKVSPVSVALGLDSEDEVVLTRPSNKMETMTERLERASTQRLSFSAPLVDLLGLQRAPPAVVDHDGGEGWSHLTGLVEATPPRWVRRYIWSKKLDDPFKGLTGISFSAAPDGSEG